MAFTGEDLANFDNALKTFQYQEVIRDIDDRVPLYKTIKGRASGRPTGGKSLTTTWEALTGANLGWGPLTEAGDLATPRKGIYKNYSLSPAHLNCGFEYSGHLAASGYSDKYAWIYAEAENFANETKLTVTRLVGILIMLDGTANIGTVLSVSTNTITMDTGQIMNILLGMRLTIRDAASAGSELLSGAQPASGTVTDTDYPNNKFTITDASTGSSLVGGYIAIYEFYGATLPNALRNIVSGTGTFQGIPRATAGNKFAVSQVRTDTGALGDNMLIQTAHDVLKMSPDNSPTSGWLAIQDYDSQRWYYLTKQDQVRYTAGEKKITGGYSGVGLSLGGGGEVVLTADPRAWPGETTFIKPDDWFIQEPASGLKDGWLENGSGGYLFQKTGSAANGVYADAKQGWWVKRYNIGCDKPRNQARLTGYRSI